MSTIEQGYPLSCLPTRVRQALVLLVAALLGLPVLTPAMAADPAGTPNWGNSADHRRDTWVRSQDYSAEEWAHSDLNKDGSVDLEDLALFSLRYLDHYVDEVDWCKWLNQGVVREKHRRPLLDFIRAYFECDQRPVDDRLTVVHRNDYPSRIAAGPNGDLYVTDPRAGSVFIYDPLLILKGEIKGLDKPLGIAVDGNGRILVGCDGTDRIETFSAAGEPLAIIGAGELAMPTDMALGRDGHLYVADSDQARVFVYDPSGRLLRAFGTAGPQPGDLRFPVAVAVGVRADPATGVEAEELYVADRGQSRIYVFDPQGVLLRSFGGRPYRSGGWFRPTWVWQGLFMSLISLAVDSQGNVHAGDAFMNNVQVLDPIDGHYLSHYGGTGTAEGQLRLPFDVCMREGGEVLVTDTMNKRIARFTLGSP